MTGVAAGHVAGDEDWSGLDPAEVDDRLRQVTAAVHRVGTVQGQYAEAMPWGERALVLGTAGSGVRRADLMLHLSELHRVTGGTERSAELVHGAADLLDLSALSPAGIEALAPVSCHALFCLGALAFWEGRPEEAEPHLAHARAHGGDSVPHLWSLVNHALLESGRGRHPAALALEDAALAMAERLGEDIAVLAVRNNRACTLRRLGRHHESLEEFGATLPAILADDVPDGVLTSCEDLACVLFDLGRDRDAALLLGAAEAERASTGVPRMAYQDAELAPSVGAGRVRLGAEWDALTARGAELGVMAAAASALRRG